jgi:hypothetical protein
MSARTALKTALILAGLGAAGIIGAISPIAPAAFAASPQKPAISPEARAAVAQMGKTQLDDQFSLQAGTLRVYVSQATQPLHVGHTIRSCCGDRTD